LSRLFFKIFGKEQADDGTAKIAKLNREVYRDGIPFS